MRSGTPIESLAAAFHGARLTNLLPVEYPEVDYKLAPPGERKAGKPSMIRVDTGRMKLRRPHAEELSVVMFEQCWSSTALGFGGVGGAAMTYAYTTIITGPMGDAAVYFGGRFAYRVEQQNEHFMHDVADRRMRSVRDAAQAYQIAGATTEQKDE